MQYYSRFIGTGGYVPAQKLSNFDLEEMLNTSDEWIRQRTGIENRHWASTEECTTDLALKACEEAIENAGIDKKEIDMIIFATLSPDHEFPGAGCFLQAKLGLEGIPAFDIRQQCSGYIYGMSMADTYIRSGQYKTILLVGAEIHSKGMLKTEEGRNISVLFGDGAGACIMQRTEVQDPKTDSHVLTSKLHADGSFAKELWVPFPGSAHESGQRVSQQMIDEKSIYPYMNGRAVFNHACRKMIEVLKESMEEAQVTPDDVDLYIFHQANLRINEKIAEMFNIPSEKVFNTIQKYGNTTAATIPLGLNDAVKAGKLKKGMLVASAAFGSGFTWASSIYRW